MAQELEASARKEQRERDREEKSRNLERLNEVKAAWGLQDQPSRGAQVGRQSFSTLWAIGLHDAAHKVAFGEVDGVGTDNWRNFETPPLEPPKTWSPKNISAFCVNKFKVKPEHVFQGDETSLKLVGTGTYGYFEVGAKDVGMSTAEEKRVLTVMPFVTASNEFVAPMILV